MLDITIDLTGFKYFDCKTTQQTVLLRRRTTQLVLILKLLIVEISGL